MFLLVLLALLCPFAEAAERQQHTQAAHTTVYANYGNPRFGFWVRYPRSLKLEPPPENGDGRRFFAADGFQMAVWGGNNVEDDTLASAMSTARREDFTRVTYQTAGRNWFVLSGRKGAKIVYEKVYVGKGSSNTLSISYPATLKAKYDKVVTTISSSFKPGNLAEGD